MSSFYPLMLFIGGKIAFFPPRFGSRVVRGITTGSSFAKLLRLGAFRC